METELPHAYMGVSGEGAEQSFEGSVELLRSEIQKIIDARRPLFDSFAGDSSLRYQMSDGFYFDLESGVVNVDTKWFLEQGYSKEQTIWAIFHELSHFKDMASDPEKMLANFGYMADRGRDLAKRMIAKWGEGCGEQNPDLLEKFQSSCTPKGSKKMSALENSCFASYHVLYNSLDDIFVNHAIARTADRFNPSEPGGKKIEELYREKLFPGNNYHDSPLHRQFVDALLRQRMVPTEKVEVDDVVKELLEREIRFQGKTYANVSTLIEEFLIPKKGSDTLPGQRYFIIKNLIEPLFQEALDKDLENWDPKNPEQKQKGSPQESNESANENPSEGEDSEQSQKGAENKPQNSQEGEGSEEGQDASTAFNNPFESFNEQHQKTSPDQLSSDQIEEWLKDKIKKDEQKKEEEERKKEEDSKSAEQKAQEASEIKAQRFAEQNGLDYKKDIVPYREIEKEVEPYLEQLATLWRRIVYGSAREREKEVSAHHKRGTGIDIPSVIKEWPAIVAGDSEPPIMERAEYAERLVEKPEEIRIRLVCDMSGSMVKGNKLPSLQRCVVLMLSSLREFNTYLNMTRSETKSKLRVSTEVRTFSDDTEVVKPITFSSGRDDLVSHYRIMPKISHVNGGTYDNIPLEEINQSITESDRSRIKEGKLLDIVIEITDGGSMARNEAREQVDALLESGAIVRSIQIGEVNEREKEAFDFVWNAGRQRPLGEPLGDNIEGLSESMARLLEKYLSRVKL